MNDCGIQLFVSVLICYFVLFFCFPPSHMLPVLLEAFPAPPSFIPSNPPPTAPPSLPLPPVPGYGSEDSFSSVDSDEDVPSSPDLKALLFSTPRPRTVSDCDDEIAQLHRELDGDDDSDDSSIDLHTPLPYVPVFCSCLLILLFNSICSHLMLRHGLLSPNSKLLHRGSTSVPPSPSPADRPGSVVSMGAC
jgi:large subunit ribosomal protein LP1